MYVTLSRSGVSRAHAIPAAQQQWITADNIQKALHERRLSSFPTGMVLPPQAARIIPHLLLPGGPHNTAPSPIAAPHAAHFGSAKSRASHSPSCGISLPFQPLPLRAVVWQAALDESDGGSHISKTARGCTAFRYKRGGARGEPCTEQGRLHAAKLMLPQTSMDDGRRPSRRRRSSKRWSTCRPAACPCYMYMYSSIVTVLCLAGSL